jgi:hypothetical protein
MKTLNIVYCKAPYGCTCTHWCTPCTHSMHPHPLMHPLVHPLRMVHPRHPFWVHPLLHPLYAPAPIDAPTCASICDWYTQGTHFGCTHGCTLYVHHHPFLHPKHPMGAPKALIGASTSIGSLICAPICNWCTQGTHWCTQGTHWSSRIHWFTHLCTQGIH